MQQRIEQDIKSQISDAEVIVEVDGNRALITVTSPVFADMNRVQRQQAVYACINPLIADGSLHAVTIRADVPSH